jgi:hypothetical protein
MCLQMLLVAITRDFRCNSIVLPLILVRVVCSVKLDLEIFGKSLA